MVKGDETSQKERGTVRDTAERGWKEERGQQTEGG